MARTALVLALCAVALHGQQDPPSRNRLGVPNPTRQDVPFIIHGSEIRELERVEASEELRKNDLFYWIPGAASTVQTPLAAPEFLLDSDQLDPRNLRLYAFSVRGDRREILFRKKKKAVAEPYFLHLTPVGDRIVRIRTNASLPPGEYGLTPDGENTVFPFRVF